MHQSEGIASFYFQYFFSTRHYRLADMYSKALGTLETYVRSDTCHIGCGIHTFGVQSSSITGEIPLRVIASPKFALKRLTESSLFHPSRRV